VKERKKASQITSLPYVAATPIVDQRKAATKIFSDMQGGDDRYIKSSSRKTAAEPNPRFGAAPSFNPFAAVVPPYMKYKTVRGRVDFTFRNCRIVQVTSWLVAVALSRLRQDITVLSGCRSDL